ncbi:MAG: DUF1579 family protein [Planctomycetales bacterium]
MLSVAALVVASSMVVGQTSIPDEARKSLGYYVGEWKGEWKQGEKKGTTELSIKWVPGKHCTINHYVVKGPEGEFHGCVISGWDPDKKQVVDTGYESNGSTFEDRWTIKSDALEEGGSKNTVPQEGVTKGQCRIEKIGPDEFTYTKTNIDSDGKKTIAFTGRYRRQSGAAK